jgi:hypothetical protein
LGGTQYHNGVRLFEASLSANNHHRDGGESPTEQRQKNHAGEQASYAEGAAIHTLKLRIVRDP